MKINRIDIYRHTLPIKNAPYTMARVQVYSLESVIVRLIADCGTVGWGEACPVGSNYDSSHVEGIIGALKELAPQLVGHTANIRAVYQTMDSTLCGHSSAKAAIDIAMHDLCARKLDIPVHQLIGGALHTDVPAYYATGVCSPDETERVVKEKIAEGYQRLQIKIGGRDLQEDIASLHRAHQASQGRVRLIADANRGLTTQQAILLSQQCKDIPLVIEQACNTMSEIKTLKGRLHHPILIDESSTDLSAVVAIIESGVCDGFGMKMTRMGGLSPMQAFRDLCQARSIPHTCDDSWGGDIIAAACVHIAATVREPLLEGVWIAAPYIEQHYDPENAVFAKDGMIKVPTEPGLGVNPQVAQFGTPVLEFD